MNKYFRKVLESLKTNKDIKALGFSRKELKGIAANVADKLTLEENASDEDVNESINDAIDDVLPLLKLTQSAADRQVQEFRRANPAQRRDDDPDDDDDELDNDDDEPGNRKSPSRKGKKSKQVSGDENDSAFAELKEMFTSRFDKLDERMNAIESGKTADSRRSKVEKMLRDTGKFGERQLKAFSRMTFKDDEEFEDYLEELEAELEDVNQDRANEGLEKLGTPPATPRKKSNDEDETMTDDEIKALAHD